MTTKRDVDKSPFLIVKNQQNNDVKLVVSPSSFQVGLTNSPSSLTATGHATFQQGITSNNPAYFYQGLSGSLTKLTDGTSYLVAGSNVTITSASNGQVTISSTAGGGGSGDVVGPASATDNAIVRFDLTTGKLIQDSAVTIADTTGNITTPGDIAVNGGDVTTTAGTATLFNTNATILNLGGAATTIEIGAATGTTSVNNSLTVDGSATLGDAAADVITVNGTTTFVGAGVTTTFAGDIAINGGDVTTTAATFNIANANATTVNIGGAATTVGVGSSTGVTTINNRLSATGGTFLLLDAELGNAAVGSHPAFESTTPTVYALFGHKDLNHAVDGNYALVQSNAGDTFIGASSTCDIYFKNGTDAIGQLSNDTVSFTGKSGTATTATIGNTTGASTTTINAGTGGIDIDHVGTATINIGTNNETRTTNISTGAANQTVTVGSNYGGSTLALRGGSDSSGGQIDVETGTGGGGNGGDINIGATSYARRVNLGTGGNSTAQDVTIGSTYLGSDIKIYAGQAGVINIGSNSVTGRTINIATGQTDGNTNIGTSTGTGMLNLHTGTGDINIGTSDYTRTVKIGSDTSCITRQTVNVAPLNTGNYNIVKICDGASNTGHEVRIISENSSQSGGYALVKIGTIANTCQTTIGNNSSNSFTKIYGGANGVTIDVQAGSSINVGGTDAVAQSVTIGNITGASTTTIQAGSGGITFTGDATLSGDLAVNGGDITTTAGTFNLVNAASTINLGSTAVTRAINIGTNATNVQTINVGTGNAANAITIGTQTGAGSTTIKAGSGNVNLDSTNFINLKYNGNTVGYVGPGFLWYEVNFSGLNNIMNLSYFGNSYGGSGTYIRAGSGAINLSGSATTTITGSTSGQADAHIGDVEIGSLPGFAGQYAMFGHKDLNHSFGNYAIAQQNDGTTYLNAPENDYVYFTSAGNPAHNGYIGYNTVFGTLINFQGRSGQRAAVTIGNTTSTSATSIYAGSGGITLSGSNQTTIITGSSSTSADVHIGDAEIGSLPGFSGQYAMFGHKDLNHAFGNYAIAQQNDGDTYLNAPEAKYVYFTSAGDPSNNGYIGYTGAILGTLINLQGRSGQRASVTIGNSTSTSLTSIYAGSGGITLSGSNQTTVITGSSSTSADAHIGDAEIGSLPGFAGQYAMFGHKDLNHAFGNYAVAQQNDGTTYLNAPEDDYVYFTSAGNVAHNGYIGYNTVFGTLINFQGRSGQRAAVTIGNATSTSATSIYAGSGGITLSGSGGQTVITGSTTSYTDATIGAWEIGSLPATQGTFPNVYAFIGHKDLNHSSDGNYALVQSNVGDTFIGAVSTKDVYFKNGTSFIGQISNDTISFTGSPAASVTTVVGSVTGSSSTSIYAGSGGLYLSGSATTTTPGTIITGSRPTSVSDAYIGPLEVGVWPSNVGYGMIMHKDLAYTNEYALLQQNNGNTYLNCGAAASTLLRYNGTTRIQLNSTGIGFFGATPVAKQTVASDTLANLYTALRNYGLIV